MNFKNIAKKWGKIALCSATLIGATGGIMAVDNVVNEPAITAKAATVSYITINNVRVDNFPIVVKQTTHYYYQGVYETSQPGRSYTYNSIDDITEDITFEEKEYNDGVYDCVDNYTYTINGVSGGSAGSVVIKKISFETDTTAPVINGATRDYYVNVDNPLELSKILEGVYAEDETDGRISYSITTDNYSSNKNRIGTYAVVLSATDNAGNTATLNINIHVTDVTIPTISGKNSYISNMSSPITEAAIRAGLTASDNVDNNLEVKLKRDNLTGNEQKKGKYTITYYAVDAATNTSNDYVVTVTVVDDIKPTISGEKNFTVASTATITSDYIISKLTANDNCDGSDLIIALVEDGYTANKNKVGTYPMTFKVMDTAGNTSDIYTVNITVTDDIPPVFYVPGSFIGVDASINLTHEEIVDIILNQNGIDTTQVVAYRFIEDNYTTNAAVTGTHTVSLQLQMNDGSIQSLSAEIEVINGEDEAPSNPSEENSDDKWYKTAWNWVKDHATYFYVGIGALIVGIAATFGFRKKDN